MGQWMAAGSEEDAEASMGPLGHVEGAGDRCRCRCRNS